MFANSMFEIAQSLQTVTSPDQVDYAGRILRASILLLILLPFAGRINEGYVGRVRLMNLAILLAALGPFYALVSTPLFNRPSRSIRRNIGNLMNDSVNLGEAGTASFGVIIIIILVFVVYQSIRRARRPSFGSMVLFALAFVVITTVVPGLSVVGDVVMGINDVLGGIVNGLLAAS